MQSVYKVSEPTCRELSGWSLCIWFLNLPPKDCPQGVQPDFTCSEPTSRGQSAGVYLVLQFPNLTPWECQQGVIDCL